MVNGSFFWRIPWFCKWLTSGQSGCCSNFIPHHYVLYLITIVIWTYIKWRGWFFWFDLSSQVRSEWLSQSYIISTLMFFFFEFSHSIMDFFFLPCCAPCSTKKQFSGEQWLCQIIYYKHYWLLLFFNRIFIWFGEKFGLWPCYNWQTSSE